MKDIEIFNGPITNLIPDAFKTTYRTTVEWLNRSIVVISSIPTYLQQNPSQAFAVFFTANAIVFYGLYLFAQFLDDRAAESSHAASVEDLFLNHLLINGVIVGVSILLLNTALSNVLQYPLTHTVLVAVAAGAISLRIILSTLFPAEE